MTLEIVLLAMIAVFVGLRLYAVLGTRTGHEQQPVSRPEAPPETKKTAPAVADVPASTAEPSGLAYEKGAAAGIGAIIAADPTFDVARFIEGAQAAYRMTLEAFWKGDREELAFLANDQVRGAFVSAIDAREAEIEVRFDAFVAAVTRNAEGELVAGSMSDAVPTNDVWTFRRDLRSDNPNWLLVETDDVA